MSETLTVPYGAKTLTCRIPAKNFVGIFEPKKMQPRNQLEEIEHALNEPIGTERIGQLVRKGARIAVVVDDMSRNTPVDLILPILLDRLNKCGIPNKDIRVIVGLGTHQSMNQNEIGRKYGAHVAERVRIVNHEPRNLAALEYLGETETKIPVWINKSVLEADCTIGVGGILPHRNAGWSGGAKIIMPGVSGFETVGFTHVKAALIPSEKILGIPENPIRRDIELVAERVGLDMIVNTVLDEHDRVSKAVAGDFVKAHRAAVEYAQKYFSASLPSRSEIVVADSYPFFLDFWSSGEKGLSAAEIAVEEGGTIIFAHPCQRGIGAGESEEEFLRLCQFSWEEIHSMVESREAKDLLAAAVAMKNARIKERARVVLVSDGITEKQAARLGFHHYRSLSSAIEDALATNGSDSRITALRQAARLVPTISG